MLRSENLGEIHIGSRRCEGIVKAQQRAEFQHIDAFEIVHKHDDVRHSGIETMNGALQPRNRQRKIRAQVMRIRVLEVPASIARDPDRYDVVTFRIERTPDRTGANARDRVLTATTPVDDGDSSARGHAQTVSGTGLKPPTARYSLSVSRLVSRDMNDATRMRGLKP